MMGMKDVQTYIEKRKTILSQVKKIIAERLNLALKEEEIDDDSPLFGMGLGLDSIDALELVVGVEENFGVQIEEENLHVFRSVNSLVDYIMTGESKSNEVTDEWIDTEDASYRFLRESALLYHPHPGIYELSESEESLDFISKVVSGKDIILEAHRILHSIILDDGNGAIIDIVYIMMFDDKYWIFFSKDNADSKQLLLTYAKEYNLDLKDITDQYTVLAIEGPYSWKIIKDMISLEVIGLPYLYFMRENSDGHDIIISRCGVTSEYGFRIYIPVEITDDFINKLTSFNEFELKEITDDTAMKSILSRAAYEVRFPIFNMTINRDDCPVENELRWMIDFKKAEYIGKEIIEKKIHNYRRRVVGFIVGDDIEDSEIVGIQSGSNIFLDDTPIGSLKVLLKSPCLKKYIGYGSIDKEWAYVGIRDYYIVSSSGKKIYIYTFSTPFFTTRSILVQME